MPLLMVATVLALVGTVALGGSVSAATSAGSTDVLVRYRAAGWRYGVVDHGANPGFEAVGFDDSAWATGKAAFGTPSAGCPLSKNVRTAWSTDTDILLRRTISVGSLSTLTISVAIDNDVDVYLDGTLVGTQVHEGCAERGSLKLRLVNIASGEHLLALRGSDRGVISYIAARVTAEHQGGYVPQPGAQPDARIRRVGGVLRGDNVYNADGSGQWITGTGMAFRGRFAVVITIQNDGDAPDAFTVAATGSNVAYFHIGYYHSWGPDEEITDAVEAGTFTTPTIAPGRAFRMRAWVRIGGFIPSSPISRLVTARSVSDPAMLDAIGFTVKPPKAGPA